MPINTSYDATSSSGVTTAAANGVASGHRAGALHEALDVFDRLGGIYLPELAAQVSYTFKPLAWSSQYDKQARLHQVLRSTFSDTFETHIDCDPELICQSSTEDDGWEGQCAEGFIKLINATICHGMDDIAYTGIQPEINGRELQQWDTDETELAVA